MRRLYRPAIFISFALVAIPAAQSALNFPEVTSAAVEWRFFCVVPKPSGTEASDASRASRASQGSPVDEQALKTWRKPVLVTEPVVAPADDDRGCCLWKAESPKCSYTNRKYCETKAKELKVKFEFHKEKACKEVGGCPAPSLG